MKNPGSMEFASKVTQLKTFNSLTSKSNSAVFSEMVRGILEEASNENNKTDLEKEKVLPQELQPPVLINVLGNDKLESRMGEAFSGQEIQFLRPEQEQVSNNLLDFLKTEDKKKSEEVSSEKENYSISPFFIAQNKNNSAMKSFGPEYDAYIASETKTMMEKKLSEALTSTLLENFNANQEVESQKEQIENTNINDANYQISISREVATPFASLTPQLLGFVENLISNWNGDSITAKDSKNLEKLMEKWTYLQKELTTGSPNSQLIFNEYPEISKKAQTILLNLLNTYQKRTFMENTGKYKSEATVSSTDVSKWFKQALERFTEPKDMLTKEIKYTGQMTSPITKVEQFTVHLQQTNQITDNQELIKEFERVLQSSKFMKTNGTTEILLKLKPANLGEITLKMVEINGEMTVKITVISQMAKDMLEGNLHQLRHMFSPAQVTIEKMENNHSLQDSYHPDSAQDSFGEEHEAESDTNEQTKSESIESEKESVKFSELLTVEKEQVS